MFYGMPVSIYHDQRTIFVSPKGAVNVEEQLEGKQLNSMQFGRAMEKSGVTAVNAKRHRVKIGQVVFGKLYKVSHR